MRMIFTAAALLAFIGSCKNDSFEHAPQSQSLYTTAAVLNIRTEPDISAPRIFQIPFGTAVATSKKNSETWLYLPDLNGYGSAEFFQDTMPPDGKNFTIRSRTENCLCGSEGHAIESNLVLSKGKADWSSVAYLAYDKEEIHVRGEYSIAGHALSILIPQHRLTACNLNEGPASCTVQDRAAFSFRLFWSEEARGFITDAALKALSDSKNRLNASKCVIVPTYVSPFFDCNSYCEEKAKGEFEIIGYYCAR
ncbi:MAG: SH3 domain-containing protein [Spirochaetales bacterium]|nr:SH3 domain-containing protein [Spirochaetales bacterium]